jgi:hypothetical protein
VLLQHFIVLPERSISIYRAKKQLLCRKKRRQ